MIITQIFVSSVKQTDVRNTCQGYLVFVTEATEKLHSSWTASFDLEKKLSFPSPS
jgi:hypothetical protein